MFEYKYPPFERKPTQLLVLGGGVLPDGQPRPTTEQRAIKAATQDAHFPVDDVIFSGGYSALRDSLTVPGPSEAELMAEIAEEHGLPAHKIHLEPEATNTAENFLNSVDLFRPGLIGVITDRLHMRRALWVGRKVLGKREIIGVPTNEVRPSPADLLIEGGSSTFNHLLFAGIRRGRHEVVSRRNQRRNDFYDKRLVPGIRAARDVGQIAKISLSGYKPISLIN